MHMSRFAWESWRGQATDRNNDDYKRFLWHSPDRQFAKLHKPADNTIVNYLGVPAYKAEPENSCIVVYLCCIIL